MSQFLRVVLAQRQRLLIAAVVIAALSVALFTPCLVRAGTTGTITGTVTDSETGAPLQGVKVSATSGSGAQTAYTNRAGFYSVQALNPDTYTVSFSLAGYELDSTVGVNVNQDQTSVVDRKLTKTVRTLGRVPVRASSNLVQPHTGTDVYNINGSQLAAASGGDDLHKTLYEYTATVPGLAPIGGAFPSEPSIRGGQDTDNGYEYDGIPIAERILGFFTSNLSNVGIGNLEVYTGGLNAGAAANGTGIINSVVKAGRYPAFGSVAFGFTSPAFNHKIGLEYGGATPDNRFSYYMAFGGVLSDNQYNYGENTYPNLVYGPSGVSSTNAGPVNTRDLVGNFHYRPSAKDDIQVMVENSLYDQNNSYLLNTGTPGAPLLKLAPCPGALPDPSDTFGTFGMGGIAPNGQPCPGGLYFKSLANGDGVATRHYGGLGKIQWNRVVGDHASIAFRLAENFNQYLFDQVLTDPNNPGSVEPPLPAGCPPLPYKAGAPLPITPGGSTCTHDSGDYYQDRNSRMYIAAMDYTDTPTANLTLKAGVGQEYDQNYRDIRNLATFNPNTGAWPGRAFYGAISDIPTHIPYVYAQASVNSGHFTIEPGLRYQREWYGIPTIPNSTDFKTAKSISVGSWIPTVAGTYRVNDNNVVRFSWGDTAAFVGTAYVWRMSSNHTVPTFYNPFAPGAAVAPQINHNADLMWEHQFAPNTSLRIGPWIRHTDNYFEEYNPILGFDSSGNPIFSKEDVPTNGLKIRAAGVELGFSHLDQRPTGASVWLSGSYDNYWTTATSGNSGYYNFPLPSTLVNQGVYVRQGLVPLFAGTFLADLHSNGFRVLPLVYYSFDSFYNIAVLNPAGTQISQNEGKGSGYFVVNTTVSKDFDHGNFTVGIRGTNLTNNLQGTTPCQVDNNGTGCFPFNGPLSGVHATPSLPNCVGLGSPGVPSCSFINQKVSQDARLFEFFFIRRF